MWCCLFCLFHRPVNSKCCCVGRCCIHTANSTERHRNKFLTHKWLCFVIANYRVVLYIHMCIWVEVGVWSCLAGGQEDIRADDWLWPHLRPKQDIFQLVRVKGGRCRSSSEKKSEQFMSRDCWCLHFGILEMFRFHVEQNIFQNIFQKYCFWSLWRAAASNSINPSISCPAVGVFKTLWNTSDSPAELRISIKTTQQSSGAKHLQAVLPNDATSWGAYAYSK